MIKDNNETGGFYNLPNIIHRAPHDNEHPFNMQSAKIASRCASPGLTLIKNLSWCQEQKQKPLQTNLPLLSVSRLLALDFDRYVPLFVTFVDIPVGLSNLFKWIALVYDWFQLSLLNKLFEENGLFPIVSKIISQVWPFLVKSSFV